MKREVNLEKVILSRYEKVCLTKLCNRLRKYNSNKIVTYLWMLFHCRGLGYSWGTVLRVMLF